MLLIVLFILEISPSIIQVKHKPLMDEDIVCVDDEEHQNVLQQSPNTSTQIKRNRKLLRYKRHI